MSLLLDALKKSGDRQQGTGLSGLTLEDAPPPRAASATFESATASRSAGETLFAAKKKKGTTMRWNLGLVPTTLLICSVIGAGYGYYVWLEIQPPKNQRVAKRTPPPPAAPITAPVAAAPLVPYIPPAPPEAVAPPPEPQQPIVTARNEDFDMPRVKPRASTPRSRPASGVTFQRKVEADTVTPALLDAWQAYQRGEYDVAEQGYRQVLGRDAHNRDALLGLAAIAQQRGQDETAQNYYRKLLVLDPRDPVAQGALTSFAPESDSNTESRLKQMLAAQPRSGSLHFALGNLYAGQSSWAEAQQSYFNAYTLEPSNAQFAFNLAVSLDHLGQGKLAAQHYRQALQLDVSGNSGFDRVQAERRLNELTPAQ
ncbi:MAG: tetratricopeptide repeat protein [Gammaproteobacteria bacterium]|nr:tetratricopeptide repeat protein [Gammaproteobacteria bacterium]MBU1777187.1 tetratricopeptide repeat protein [Gammaproteobacteria bacterium]MBU1968489.1 tetratricopeptide repeat protein [Gammaproteobacteria bacterium]